jgi:hypothetical protein
MSELGVDIHSAHITPFTLNDITRHISQLNTYDSHSLFLQQPHALKSMAAPNTPNRLHPTWWVSSLFCNLQTSIRTNNHKSSNSDYSCSINFSDRIVTLYLSLQHPFSNLELVGGTCTFTFWGVLAPWRSCLYQGSPHVELVGGTSLLTDVRVPRIVGASCEESCNDPWHGKTPVSHHSMYNPITNQFI